MNAGQQARALARLPLFRAACRKYATRSERAQYYRDLRRRRAARREWVNGHLTAPLPADKHGKRSTFLNWSCKCERCLDAWRQSYG